MIQSAARTGNSILEVNCIATILMIIGFVLGKNLGNTAWKWEEIYSVSTPSMTNKRLETTVFRIVCVLSSFFAHFHAIS